MGGMWIVDLVEFWATWQWRWRNSAHDPTCLAKGADQVTADVNFNSMTTRGTVFYYLAVVIDYGRLLPSWGPHLSSITQSPTPSMVPHFPGTQDLVARLGNQRQVEFPSASQPAR